MVRVADIEVFKESEKISYVWVFLKKDKNAKVVMSQIKALMKQKKIKGQTQAVFFGPALKIGLHVDAKPPVYFYNTIYGI